MLTPDEKKPSTVLEGAGLVSTPSEAPKNNGIPIFIQERLDERQKKREDMESTERLSMVEVSCDLVGYVVSIHVAVTGRK